MWTYEKTTDNKSIAFYISKNDGKSISNLTGKFILLELKNFSGDLCEGKIIADNDSRIKPNRLGRNILFDSSLFNKSNFDVDKMYLIIDEDLLIAYLN